MADLIAQGPEAHQRWRHPLRLGETFVLGRQSGAWSVAWDEHLSRQHAQLCWKRGVLHVERLPSARNPVYWNGTQHDEFTLTAGDHFVIGETTFTLTADQATISRDAPQPVREQAYNSNYLRSLHYRNADQRVEVLSRLPEVISGTRNDAELFARLVNLLLAGIPHASAVALVAANPPYEDEHPVHVLHWDQRLATGGDFQPSRSLILESLKRSQSVSHVWDTVQKRTAQFTAADNIDWAFCTPVDGQSCRGWAIYVAGRFRGMPAGAATPTDTVDLRDDVKFTELVTATLASLRDVQQLQRKQAALSNFFPPAVLDALDAQGEENVLAPREIDVSVLFCDLRGFSRKAEQQSDDLLGLLERVSRALGVMTHHILDQGGVVGDFQGDAAMGFWGWPLVQEDLVQRAAMAALAIRLEFEAAALRPGHALHDFRVGIGLATGRAVAGGIGTSDQLKVTVFGPVVNLASRLEGMTKILRAPILIDDVTARFVRDSVDPRVARVRRVAGVQPYGMNRSLEVSELLPPEAEYPQLSNQDLANYEAALDAFLAGDWDQAIDNLHHVPPHDRVKDYLTVFIAQHDRNPPADWDGVIQMSSKS